MRRNISVEIPAAPFHCLHMKIGLVLSLLLALPGMAFARDTAYQALRTAAQAQGDGILGRVIEVQGTSGIPQPEVWKIVIDDPSARAGVRELQVAGKRVKSERTPTRGYSGAPAPMDFNRLNLDSEGAFSIANEEATKARVGFDSASYALRAGEGGAAPRWKLELLDQGGREVGSLLIAADTGTVISKTFNRRQQARGNSVVEEDREFVREDRRERETGRRDSGGGVLGTLDRFGNRVERHVEDDFRYIGGKLQKFFTGRNTLDPERPRR